MYLKYFDKIQKWVPPHKKKEKSSDQYMSANIFHGTAQQRVDLSPLDFCLCGHLKTLVCSAAIENEDTLHDVFFVPVKPVLISPGTFENVSQSMIRVHECIDSGGGHSENLFEL
jgi:hypothetical protein